MNQIASRSLWAGRVEQWRQSGVSQAAFARQHNLDIKRLRYWVKRAAQANRSGELIAVSVKPEIAAAAQARPNVTLRSPTGWSVTLPSDVSAAWLGELLQGLR